jgi:hypothetical protein
MRDHLDKKLDEYLKRAHEECFHKKRFPSVGLIRKATFDRQMKHITYTSSMAAPSRSLLCVAVRCS